MKEAEKMLRKHAKHLQGWKTSQVTAKDKPALALKKTFRFRSSVKGADFVHALWKAAEKQNHHPDIVLSYGRVVVTWTTHSVSGLTEKDFLMAAATEEIYGKFV
ncbi:MAG: 4a-hydroxytetrahydrobiopterin dehydratase [Candidatus Kerfeldbacteria bacterium]|nr:4a-hydroxytetrahydrobiopterin dehydratase [Candidatus Kerfeldbacteria bacterium]